jgi:hypothetical protein
MPWRGAPDKRQEGAGWAETRLPRDPERLTARPAEQSRAGAGFLYSATFGSFESASFTFSPG